MLTYPDIVDFEPDQKLILPPADNVSENLYKNVKASQLGFIDKQANVRNTSSPRVVPPAASSQLVPRDQTQSARNTEKSSQLAARHDPPVNVPSTSPWKLRRVIAGAHQGWVRSLAIDPVTNQWFASGAADANIKIWDLALSQLKATLTGHIMGVRALAMLAKFPYLFSGSEDKTVRCWDLERSNVSLGCQIREYHGHVGGIYAMALHPEIDILLTGGRDSVVRVWDIRSRAQAMVLTGHHNDITSIVSQTGDPQVISSSMDGTIRLWDLRKQSTLLCLTHHSKSIRLLVLHPRESTFCSGDSAGNIKQWLLPGGELLNDLGYPENGKIINSLLINPASGVLFAGHDDGRMEFYDYVLGNRLQEHVSAPVPGTPDLAIYTSSFDYSGLRLITGEGDNCIKIWGQDDYI